MRRKPDVREDLIPFWRCFRDCDDARPVSDGWTPIPSSEVESWCRIHGFTSSEFMVDCLAIVRKVDTQRRDIEADRRQEERRKREAESKRRSRNANP